MLPTSGCSVPRSKPAPGRWHNGRASVHNGYRPSLRSWSAWKARPSVRFRQSRPRWPPRTPARRQMRRRENVRDQPDAHADAGCGETIMPTDLLAEGAADKRRQKRPKIDAYIKYRECTIAARIAGPVEIADLHGNIRLERAVAEDQQQQRK